VCLPTHEDTVGYEEGDPRVSSMLKMGYPRFKIHAAVELLVRYMSKQHSRLRFADDEDAQSDLADVEDDEDEDEAERARDFGCFVFPTLDVAKRFQSFMESGLAATSEITIRSVHFEAVTAVFFPKTLASKAKAYWQHTGEIVSSRLALDALASLGERLKSPIPSVTRLYSLSGSERLCKSDKYLEGLEEVNSDSREQAFELAQTRVHERILAALDEPRLANGIHLVPSGMAAIFSALRLSKALAESDPTGAKETRIVVFGFPYLDTLKMMQRAEFNQGGVIFLGLGDASDEERLRQLLSEQETEDAVAAGTPRIGAVFTEFPSNPLFKVPDLKVLSALAARHDFLLVVDDTLGSFVSVDLLRAQEVSVDLLCSSLTKVFSGSGDVMAGSLVINSRGRHASKLRQLATTLAFAPLYGPDTVALEHNSRDYSARCLQMGRTASLLAHWLQSQPGIGQVYYPGVCAATAADGERFDAMRRATSTSSSADGRGYLFSVVLARTDDASRSKAQTAILFDALTCCKGPSLGTNFTLSCLYTLLAHYTELDWAAGYGVDRGLVRVSVGLEDLEHLKSMFSAALWAAARPRLWRQLHRDLVRHRGLPLPALVRILSFCS